MVYRNRQSEGKSAIPNYQGVTFHPWVGARYGRDNRFGGVRLLVLGESHYGSGEEDHDTTQDVVRRWGQELPEVRGNEHRHLGFFTKTSKLLRRDPEWLTQPDREAIWDDVAFYNFVQTFVDGPRNEPAIAQWCDGQKPLDTVLSTLKPSAVLVLGKRLAGNIVALDTDWLTITFDMSRTAPAAVVTHPSGAMRYDESIPIFDDLLRRATCSRK